MADGPVRPDEILDAGGQPLAAHTPAVRPARDVDAVDGDWVCPPRRTVSYQHAGAPYAQEVLGIRRRRNAAGGYDFYFRLGHEPCNLGEITRTAQQALAAALRAIGSADG